jgi:esterase/lipase
MQNRSDLILLHGAIGNKEQLDELALELEANFKIYRFDFPGHGDKAYQISEFSLHNFVNYLRNFILKNELNNPAVFGYSMGRYVALTLESYSKTFSNIMTLNTKFKWGIETAEREKKMFIPEKIEKKVPHFAKKLKQMHGENNWKRLLEYHRGMMDDISSENVLNSRLLSSINTKVLITRSENDEMVTREESLNVLNQIKK